MSPFWETLDKIGIVVGLVTAAIQVILWVYVSNIQEDVEDIQEDVEDIEERQHGV